ncbi:hypothetical protein OAM67_01880 [bacterium]|nr:hypothetical protein [bacterium]
MTSIELDAQKNTICVKVFSATGKTLWQKHCAKTTNIAHIRTTIEALLNTGKDRVLFRFMSIGGSSCNDIDTLECLKKTVLAITATESVEPVTLKLYAFVEYHRNAHCSRCRVRKMYGPLHVEKTTGRCFCQTCALVHNKKHAKKRMHMFSDDAIRHDNVVCDVCCHGIVGNWYHRESILDLCEYHYQKLPEQTQKLYTKVDEVTAATDDYPFNTAKPQSCHDLAASDSDYCDLYCNSDESDSDSSEEWLTLPWTV